MRQQLLDCFYHTLELIHGQACVQKALSAHPLLFRQCRVIAIGKAAQAMAQGADQILAENIKQGLLITKFHHSDARALSTQWQCYEAAHPIPDETSLAAGRQLLKFITEDDDLPVLFLISGGASSLVEVLPESTSLKQWQKLNEWLLASGLGINKINVIRKKVSQIKGGKLLSYLQGRETHALLISDVPGDHLNMIGSGLLFPTQDDSISIVDSGLPDWMTQMIAEGQQYKNTEQKGLLSSYEIITNNRMALQSAKEFLTALGKPIFLHENFLAGDAEQVGRELANYLSDDAESGFHIWGGETTVVLPDIPGRGGRNQHLALSVAVKLSGNKTITVLVAGTDGSDGPTEDAGGLVDGGTLARGTLSGLDAVDCLANADSGHFLEAAGDLLYTGPTGTNVMDLIIAVKQ